MSSNSAIEWTEATWNPVTGCTPISPGCLNCYAAAMSHRLDAMGQEKYRGLTVLHNDIRTFNGRINLSPKDLDIPLKRKKPTTYFVNSMSDLFHEDVPCDYVDKVVAVMTLCPQHKFQVLTKRPARMADYLFSRGDRKWMFDFPVGHPKEGKGFFPQWPLPNVWLGCSPVNQKTLDEYMPHMLRIRAAVRFLSLEPLLGPISFRWAKWHAYYPDGWRERGESQGHLDGMRQLDWVIVGGESGPGSRSCQVESIEKIIAQCAEAGVPCFVKQLGAVPEVDDATAVSFGRQWKEDNLTGRHYTGRGNGRFVLNLKDPKGGDPAEWLKSLRVRQFPVIS